MCRFQRAPLAGATDIGMTMMAASCPTIVSAALAAETADGLTTDEVSDMVIKYRYDSAATASFAPFLRVKLLQCQIVSCWQLLGISYYTVYACSNSLAYL